MLKYKNNLVPYSFASASSCAPKNADITFDSELEYSTFCILKSIFPLECITIHRSIHLIGKIGWACDFVITPTASHPQVPVLLIESKGLVDPVFKLKVELLRLEIPSAWKRLYLVVAKTTAKPIAPEIPIHRLREVLPILPNTEYCPQSIALTERLLRLKGRVS